MRVRIELSMENDEFKKVPGIVVILKDHEANEEELKEIVEVISKHYSLGENPYDTWVKQSEEFIKDLE